MPTKELAKREKDFREAKAKMDEMMRRIERFLSKGKRKPTRKPEVWVLTSRLADKRKA